MLARATAAVAGYAETDGRRQVSEDADRYVRAAHRIQTAIAAKHGSLEQTPKHLRVGVDLSKVDQAGLATLLMAKGVFTEEEYLKALADAAEREADMRQAELSEQYGKPVTTV